MEHMVITITNHSKRVESHILYLFEMHTKQKGK